jgi:Zn-dependent M28 family amino/carboxypeptidase
VGVTEGEVYNGANDNGSGTVSILELAQAFSTTSHPRSIIFAWFTGEEQGLWGSEYFVANPPVSLEQIVYCINLDVTSGNDLSKITMIGNAQTDPEIAEAFDHISSGQFNVRLDYLEDEKSKLEFLYPRSDHYPFIKHDIPSIWISSESDGQQHIHQPSDMTEFINYEKMELVSRFTYMVTQEFTNRSK